MTMPKNTIAAEALVAPAVPVAAWKRFLAPYYVLNAVALLSYAALRELYWNKKMEEREGFLNLPRVSILVEHLATVTASKPPSDCVFSSLLAAQQEHEIFLLAAGSFAVNYRKKATLDGAISLLFLYGKMAVLAACYYMNRTLFGWYFVYVASKCPVAIAAPCILAREL